MTKQFVTYEIALKLYELGFNEECLCTYIKSDKKLQRNPGVNMEDNPIEDEPYYWKNSEIHESIIAAPLWSQCISFLNNKGYRNSFGGYLSSDFRSIPQLEYEISKILGL